MKPPSLAPSQTQVSSILVIAEQFPNAFQVWLLNNIEAALSAGAGVTVVAAERMGSSHHPRVDELGLLERTLYFPTNTRGQLLDTFWKRFRPWSASALRSYKGTTRLLLEGLGYPSGMQAWLKAAARSSLLTYRFDLIHAHQLTDAYEYLFLSRRMGIPMVTTFHGLWLEAHLRLAPAKCDVLFRHGHLFLCNTRFAQSQLVELGCPLGKIRIIPQGIRLQDYPFRPRSYSRGSKLRLLSVSRLAKDKGHKYALEAAASLRAAGIDLEYRIAGAGPERDALEGYARSLGISDLVVFTGMLGMQELRVELESAHILLFPSIDTGERAHVETQGVIMQEAQASGVIVVAARTGGIPECVEDGVSAFLVPPKDSASLAEAVHWVADHPEKWTDWQHAGRRWVEQNFDLNVIGKRIWAAYQEAATLVGIGGAAGGDPLLAP